MYTLVATHSESNDVVVKHDNMFVRIDTEQRDVVSVSPTFSLNRDWVRSMSTDIPDMWQELASSATSTLSIQNTNDVKNPETKIFRVPKEVQQESDLFDVETVSLQNIYGFVASGGHVGNKTQSWVDKVMEAYPNNLNTNEAEYFITYLSVDEPHIITSFMKKEGEQWFSKGAEFWEEVEEFDTKDAVDLAGVTELIDILYDNFMGYNLDISEFFVEEFGIFNAAFAELDLELIDRAFDIYDTHERSINAKKQVRGPGGKFIKNAKTAETPKEKIPVARLAVDLPLLENPSERIDEYLQWVKKQRGELAQSAEASGVEESDVTPLYLAIVDDIDTDAVLDLISLVPPKPGTEGDVTAWKRDGGQWVSAQEYVDQLRGSTPPSVKEITDMEILGNVLEQIDKSTDPSGAEEVPEAPGKTEVSEEGAPVEEASQRDIALGLAFSDGSLLIKNAEQLRQAISEASTYTEKLHTIKRARALNRLDLIPTHWNVQDNTSEFSLWGPYGEIIPLTAAGGYDRNRGNAERLRRYWTIGIGGQKIQWRTPGDWYRCVSLLTKHLGPRAKGYCNLRHKEMTGVYSGDKKNI